MSTPVNTPPLVSVVTIFLNGDPFMEEAIESVLAQTFDDWELILVDDGSTDASTELAKSYAEKHPGRIRYVEHDGHANLGRSASRNLGIDVARGTYLTFLDADDVYFPDKLKEQVALMRANPQLAMVSGCNVEWYSWNGGTDRVNLVGYAFDTVIEPPEAVLKMYPLGEAYAIQPEHMLRLDAVRQVGGYENEFPGMFDDQVLALKLYLEWPVMFSSQTWLKYRQHDRSCVAESVQNGTYFQDRAKFMYWLDSYLSKKPNIPQDIRDEMDRELWRCRNRLISRIWNRIKRELGLKG